MSQDRFLNIDTPENVIFDYEVAGIGSRFLAAMVDSILIVIAMLGSYIIGALLISVLGLSVDSIAPGIIIAFLGFLAFLVLWGYYIFFEIIWNGQSPGKRWQHLRVLRNDGTPIGMSESAIRNLVRIIDFLPISYGIGVITMFSNSQARRLGDFAAGTLVVHEETSVTLDDLKISATKLKTAGVNFDVELMGDSTLPVEKLSVRDIQLIEDYLQRRFELNNRAHLADQLARSLTAKMDLPPEETAGKQSEEILIQIFLTYRKQMGGLEE